MTLFTMYSIHLDCIRTIQRFYLTLLYKYENPPQTENQQDTLFLQWQTIENFSYTCKFIDLRQCTRFGNSHNITDIHDCCTSDKVVIDIVIIPN